MRANASATARRLLRVLLVWLRQVPIMSMTPHDMHDHMHHGAVPAPHGAHDHGDMVADFRRRFWISLALTVPVLATAEMVQHFLGLRNVLAFPGDRYVEFVFASAIYFYGGWPFLTGLIAEQSPSSLTLLDARNQRAIIHRDRIEAIQESPVSLMPENLLKTLNPQELRDLFSYLQADKPPPTK